MNTPSSDRPTASFDRMIGAIRVTVRSQLRNMVRLPYREVIESDAFKRPGVYLIYDEKGELLYVGESKNLVKRLRGHLPSTGHLMRALLCEEDFWKKNPSRHICVCGVSVVCRHGDTPTAELVVATARLRERVLSSFTVGILSGSLESFGVAHERRQLETFVQWVLKPKLNSWRNPDGVSGWISIPEDDEEGKSPIPVAPILES